MIYFDTTHPSFGAFPEILNEDPTNFYRNTIVPKDPNTQKTSNDH